MRTEPPKQTGAGPARWLVFLLGAAVGLAAGLVVVDGRLFRGEGAAGLERTDDGASVHKMPDEPHDLLSGVDLLAGNVRVTSWPCDSRTISGAPRREGGIAVPEASDIPTINIRIDPEALVRMSTAITQGQSWLGREPGGRKPWMEGIYVAEDGVERSAEFAYRGFSDWHHHAAKPSLRVKLDRADATELGQRSIELSRPKDILALANWLPDQLASQVGLLSARSEHVRLFINGNYFGVYLRSRRPDKALLARSGRIPGTIFRGEVVEGRDTDIWHNLQDWNRMGRRREQSVAALSMLLRLLDDEPSPQRIGPVEDLLDLGRFAQWSALNILVAGTHQDAVHNQVLFFEEYESKFEPVPWDVMGYGTYGEPDLPPNLVLNRFDAWLLRDRAWVHSRNQVLHEWLRTTASADAQIRILRQAFERMEPQLRSDGQLASSRLRFDNCVVEHHPRDIDPALRDFERWVRQRAAYLTKFLSDARVAVSPNSSGGSEVVVFGHVAIRSSHEPDRILYPGLLHEAVPFRIGGHIDGGSVTRVYVPPMPVTYQVDAPPAELRLTNAVTGEAVQPQAAPRVVGRAFDFDPSAEDTPAPHILGPGDVHVNSTIGTAVGQGLVVKAGTTVHMGAGVSIVARGPVTAIGTAAEPILFVAAGDTPWGSIGVIGTETKGTRFEHVTVAGGGATRHGVRHLKGALSIYGCPRVVLRHSKFGANAIGDDAVNIALSNFDIDSCEWNGSRRDALDVDNGTGVIRNSRFANSGNDAIDMMGSRVVGTNLVIDRCGDKGISVGEGSQLVVTELSVRAAQIGVAIKDGSRVMLSNARLDGEQAGVHVFRKKWYFPGSQELLLHRSSLPSRAAPHSSILAQDDSSVWLVDSAARMAPGTEASIHQTQSVPPAWREFEASVKREAGFEPQGSPEE